jgi:hypothetical protein
MDIGKMDFSLILPTLGDERLVKRFFDSIERTTKKKDLIEVLLAIDEGKTDIIDFVEKQKYSFSIKWFERPITDNFSDDYYNWLADRSTGDNVMTCNDDISFKTNHWDEIAREKIKKHRWSVYLIDTLESTRGVINQDFCCFPIVSRKAINEIGFIFFPQIRMYPADKVIYSLFNEIGRVIPAHDIVLSSTYVPEDKNGRKWKIFQEDVASGNVEINITQQVTRLLLVSRNDLGPKRASKIDRIIRIIKEK